MSAESENFRAVVVARSPSLVRSACLLTGNEATAQDLVQTAILQTWRRWDRIDNKQDPEGYVRRVIMTTFLSWRRRRWRYERPTAEFTELSSPDDEAQQADLRLCVARALAALPPDSVPWSCSGTSTICPRQRPRGPLAVRPAQ